MSRCDGGCQTEYKFSSGTIAAGVGGGMGLLVIVVVSAESGCVALCEEKKVKI